MAAYDNIIECTKLRAQRTDEIYFIYHQPEAWEDCGSQGAPTMLHVMPNWMAGESG